MVALMASCFKEQCQNDFWQSPQDVFDSSGRHGFFQSFSRVVDWLQRSSMGFLICFSISSTFQVLGWFCLCPTSQWDLWMFFFLAGNDQVPGEENRWLPGSYQGATRELPASAAINDQVQALAEEWQAVCLQPGDQGVARCWLRKKKVIWSGKRLHNYGKSPVLMGTSTIFMAIFHC